MPLMDLLIEHGADVNAQVTGTKTYTLRISRAPSSKEGMTALHVAAQRGRIDVMCSSSGNQCLNWSPRVITE
jgi:ankyrin repeat protein